MLDDRPKWLGIRPNLWWCAGKPVAATANVTPVDVAGAEWPGEVDRLRALLGAPNNPRLFPAHFLKATFPKIGGQAVQLTTGDEVTAAGFLFPRAIEQGRRVYTLRYHRAVDASADLIMPDDLTGRVADLLSGARVVLYDPQARQAYAQTSRMIEGIDVGAPDEAEARAMRAVAAEIWGSEPDALYPADLSAREFGAGTALVARREGAVAGFLFGFAKFGDSPLPAAWGGDDGALRLESQLLGVLPAARQHGIGALLKRLQGQQARERGIAIVNWTVDPLQFGNAVLNFGCLRAVAFDFTPDYYPFRNALNRVPASRLGITWPVGREHALEAIARPEPAAILDLGAHLEIARVNDGAATFRLDANGPVIAIEVPADWTRLQRDDVGQALRWREATDRLFAHYLGPEPGRYAITGVAKDGARAYLIAEALGVRR